MSPSGTWFPVEHSMLFHPKMLAAGPHGALFAVCSWGWSDLYGTDGFIPDAAVGRIAPGLEGPAARRAALRCVDVELLHSAQGGFVIHDYHEHQDTGAEVRARRMAWRERKRRQRAGLNGDGRGVTVPRDMAVTEAVTSVTKGGTKA